MSRRVVIPTRAAWEDKYRTPTVRELIGALQKQHVPAVEHARDRLGGMEGLVETVSWQGFPWRWTLTYRDGGVRERALAYIVPQPSRPVLTFQVSENVLAMIDMKRMSKMVRDGVALSPRVGEARWTQWELAAKTQADEAIALFARVREAIGAGALA